MNSRIPPELINYENQMDDYFEQHRERRYFSDEDIQRICAPKPEDFIVRDLEERKHMFTGFRNGMIAGAVVWFLVLLPKLWHWIARWF